MAEPVSSSVLTALAIIASGAAMTALRVLPNRGVALGVVCGSLVYLMRTHEPSRLRKCIYFAISLIGGYHITSWALNLYPNASTWAVGFMSSASVVTLAVLVLDWAERNIQPTLDQVRTWALDKLPGRKNHEDD
ncbi:hypothetical protein HDG34_005888 [Paraburkholderia sp. HC6.4b]|uniref:putative holin n=1 Tax=unclassified Paraburkholderia TaxID=2615204 RepID=UPI00160CA367|nr:MULTISPECIES: putative holin [unclassified Paraburkholderia]MBB5411922.1 hypothetical protein [Paraburkholderia sp. HC6.4b]MBB5450234.1 hypothetical protein [Paraburkholderia sp. Kb1A]